MKSAMSKLLQPSETKEEQEIHNDCIGNLEHHVHKVFALVRVPGEDFVYSASIDLFNRLDDYCDEQGMVESRPPFLIKGESGTGKSALLSNWLQRRERTLTRSRASNSDYFIFWHAVGCSRQSMNVNVVIKRLIVELKNRFEIDRPLPKLQERYSWELPRFLDLASKRGKVIIVIDGLNRLVNNDGTEDSLAWLPLEFPPNVRVILSVTIPTAIRIRQVGNAVKAMRALSNFGSGNLAKQLLAARDNIITDTTGTAVEATENRDNLSASAADASTASTGRPSLAAMFSKKPFAQPASITEEKSGDLTATSNTAGSQASPLHKGNSFGNDGEVKNAVAKKSRILAELDRRGIPFMMMTPLNKQLCKSLVEAFIHKSVNSESASLATGPYIATYLSKASPTKQTQNAPHMLQREGTGRGSVALLGQHGASAHGPREASEEVSGFLMFENQINALLNHSQGGTPLFLRLFLRCLQYAVSRGYSLWTVYEDWMKARSVPELLIRILRTLENNFSRTRSSAQSACDKTIAAGGLPALKLLYSWHPAFQENVTRLNTASTAQSGLAAHSHDSGENKGTPAKGTPAMTPKMMRRMSTQNQNPHLSAMYGDAGDQNTLAAIIASTNNEPTGVPTDEANKKLSSEVTQNLGDQAWYSTEQDANNKLQRGLRHTEEATAQALSKIRELAQAEQTDLLQALVKSIRGAHEAATEQAKQQEPGMPRMSQIYSLSQMRLRLESGAESPNNFNEDESYGEESECDSEDEQDSLVSIEERSITSDHTVHSRSIQITQQLIPPAMRINGGQGVSPLGTPTHKHTHPGHFHHINHHTGHNVVTGEGMVVPEPHSSSKVKSQFKNLNNNLMNGGVAPAVGSGGPTGHHASYLSSVASTPNHNASMHMNHLDPSEGLHTLPLYLRGGADTTGFGDILGNALALLYASRQGLRESELWRILSLLQYKSERDTHLTQEMKAMNHAIVRKYALLFLQSKGPLLDMFKSEDITRTGYISRKQVLCCVRRINPDISLTDLIKMLEFADLHTPPAPVHVSTTNLVHYYQDRDLLIGDRIHYNKLFLVLGKLNKQLKFAEVAPGKTGALLATVKPGAASASAGKDKATTAAAAATVHVHKQKKAHSGGDDDYSNFNLTGQPPSHTQTGAVTQGEEGGLSRDPSVALVASTVSNLSDPSHSGHGTTSTTMLNTAHNSTHTTNMATGNATIPAVAQDHKLLLETSDIDEADEEANFSLGPVIEESLLHILSALGVLHDPENKVLILPSDSEPFRQVIYNNYILKRGGGNMNYWHGLIIKHFQTEPNSLRKCEELPWHLKICRKWHALRDALVDLDSFDLMSKTDLKSELIEYWALLTEGPLPLPELEHDGHTESGRPQSGKGGKSARKSDKDDNESTYSHVLRDIDRAYDTGLNMKEARKKVYKNHCPPFDIVEELNKSMEIWVTNDKPSPAKIHATIIQVAKFLFEFSRSVHASPDFLRLGIDLSNLNLFCEGLDPEMRGMEMIIKKSSSHDHLHLLDDSTMDGSFVSGASPTKSANPGALSPGNPNNKHRLDKSVDKDKHASSEKNSFGDTTKHEGPKFPTPTMLNSNLYVYLRWIWIQFPWIGLYTAPEVALQLREQRADEEKHRYDADKNKKGKGLGATNGGSGLGGAGNTGTLNATGDAGANAATAGAEHLPTEAVEETALGNYAANNADSAMLLRVWNVKKSDPTIPVFVKSANRKLAAIKPRTSLTSMLERNVEVTYEKLYDEITSPSHIAKIRLGFKCKDKYRRPFAEEVEFNKNIPFAYHGTRAMKAGSLFPSYEKSLLESNKQRQQEREDEADKKHIKKHKVKKFDVEVALLQQLHKDVKGNTGGAPFMLIELDDEIRRMNNDEYINKHKVERIGGAVVKDETDLELGACIDRISRMKTVCNKLTVIQNEKIRLIHNLHRQVIHRHETDQQLIDEVENSEVLLRHLNTRNLAIEADMEVARQVEDGYNELLKVLKNNPPYIESHVKALEIEVQLAQKQFEDMCEHRNALYHATETANENKRQQYIEQIEYFQHARLEVANKKKQVLRQTRTLGGPGKRTKNHGRRNTKSGHQRHHLARTDSNFAENSDESGSDSDNSLNRKPEIQLTAPVMHFLNAIVRKTTFNEAVVKETDQTLEDIKRRFDEEERLNLAPSAKHRRMNRMGSIDAYDNAQYEQFALDAANAAENDANNAAMANANANLSNNASHDGDNDNNSLHSGSIGNGMSAPGTGRNSLNSKEAPNAIPRRSSALTPMGNDMYTINERRSSQHRSGHLSGYQTPDSPHMLYHQGSGSPHLLAARRKLLPEQMNTLKEAIRSFLPENEIEAINTAANAAHHNKHTHMHSHAKDVFRAQVQRAYELLLEKTASNSVDEFLDRYNEGQTLLNNLRKQQTLVDSRILQLQSEHAELFATFSDLAFIADGDENAANSGTGGPAGGNAEGGVNSNSGQAYPSRPGTAETAQSHTSATTAAAAADATNPILLLPGANDRYLDNRLFAHEVRMNKLLRNKDHAEQIVSDVRTAVNSLIHLMAINHKLMYALPRSEPPQIKTNDDIATGIMWFEDRITALSEALAMDANKPTGANTADDNKPLSERQLDLALLVQKMNLNGQGSKPNSRTGSRGNNRKARGGISSNLINVDGEEALYTSAAEVVMVPPVGRIDKIFDNKMGKLIAERERAADALEDVQRFSKDDETNASLVQNFLSEGLDLKVTKDMARSANLLINKRSGRAGNYGLVLENLLESRGQQFKPASSALRAHPREEITKTNSTAGAASIGLHGASQVNSSGVLSNNVVGGGTTRETMLHTGQPSPAARTANTTVHNSRSSSPVN